MESNVQLAANSELFQDVKKSSENETDYLIFLINEKSYALPSKDVEEILRDYQVYNIPFVPDYFCGILNRYGDPYAVIDPALLWQEKSQTTDISLFLVIKDSSHTCLKITDVKEFYSAPESAVTRLSDSDISEFVDGILKYKNKSKITEADKKEFKNNEEDVFVINIKKILERMGKDFESE